MKRQIASLAAGLAALWFAGSAVAVELVVVEQPGCVYCAMFDRDVAPAYPKTAEGEFAPLRRVQLRDLPDDIDFASRPILTPTFVLVDEGEELGRIEGYPGDEFFWPLLTELLQKSPDFAPADAK